MKVTGKNGNVKNFVFIQPDVGSFKPKADHDPEKDGKWTCRLDHWVDCIQSVVEVLK